MIDPYFSDSVEKINPNNFRRMPVIKSVFKIKPDVMIFTHNHLDHYDPETAKKSERKEVFDKLFAKNKIKTGDEDFDYYANLKGVEFI